MGLILPSANVVMEPEFNKIAPEGVAVYSTRIYIKKANIRGVFDLEKNIERAAENISSIKPTAVAFACTSGSFVGGVGFDERVNEKIRKIVKVPVTSTSTASVQAVKEMGMSRISIATPYIDELNVKAKVFFEGHGLDVLNIKGMGIEEAVEIGSLYPSEVVYFAKKVYRKDADGLFISCTNLRTIEIIDILEKDLGRPVVSANQATIWALLKSAGIQEKIEGYGKLLTQIK